MYSASADGNESKLVCIVEMPSSLGADSLAERVSLVNERGGSVELICSASMSKPNHYVCFGCTIRVGNSIYLSEPTYETQLALNALIEEMVKGSIKYSKWFIYYSSLRRHSWSVFLFVERKKMRLNGVNVGLTSIC